MHELRIAQAVIDLVQSESSRRHLTRVHAVGIRLGALSGVHPDALSFSFEAATIDTPLADAKLEIEQCPAEGKCRSCENRFAVEDFIFLCPACGAGNVDLIRGEELDVTYLVGE